MNDNLRRDVFLQPFVQTITGRVTVGTCFLVVAWKKARDYPENQDTSEWDKDADDQYVIEVSEKLFKTFGHTLKKANTELISRGLERYLGEQVFLAILDWHREDRLRDDDSLRGWETATDRYAPPPTPLCEHTDF